MDLFKPSVKRDANKIVKGTSKSFSTLNPKDTNINSSLLNDRNKQLLTRNSKDNYNDMPYTEYVLRAALTNNRSYHQMRFTDKTEFKVGLYTKTIFTFSFFISIFQYTFIQKQFTFVFLYIHFSIVF
jgi:hypothetical protein